jgi:hypothetical protein
MKTIIVSTPVGEFSRKTNTPYTHAVVRKSVKAQSVYERFLSTGVRSVLNVNNRWIKDRGFVVTYHNSLFAAINASEKEYRWDRLTEVVGVYEVMA